MIVTDVLRRKGTDVTVVPPDATLAEAASMLASQRIGALVVSSGSGAIEGILSERDIVRRVAERGASSLDDMVASAMTSEVRTCVRDDSLEELMSVMTEHRIRHLPVVTDDRLGGIVSIGDVVKHRVEELEEERRHLTEYIQTGR